MRLRRADSIGFRGLAKKVIEERKTRNPQHREFFKVEPGNPHIIYLSRAILESAEAERFYKELEDYLDSSSGNLRVDLKGRTVSTYGLAVLIKAEGHISKYGRQITLANLNKKTSQKYYLIQGDRIFDQPI